ncbi:hypothetical protein KNE206_78650 [Kitasatospora sp. NE20-6]
MPGDPFTACAAIAFGSLRASGWAEPAVHDALTAWFTAPAPCGPNGTARVHRTSRRSPARPAGRADPAPATRSRTRARKPVLARVDINRWRV